MRVTSSLLAMLLAGCGSLRSGDPAPFKPVKADSIHRVSSCASACVDSLDIVALGVGGYLFIPWRDTTQLVMTPPFYTHPGIWRMAFSDKFLRGARSDSARVDEQLAQLGDDASPERLRRVQAVLVGHAHYDHLMDLPSMVHLLPNARVYGSQTAVNLLNPVKGLGPVRRGGRLEDVRDSAAYDVNDKGKWYTLSPALRFRAVAWEHAPNFRKPGISYTIATGDVLEPLNALPGRARGWKKGRVYAYEVDVLDGNARPLLRLIVNDGAAGSRVSTRAGEVFRLEPAGRTVLLTTAASFANVDGYPDTLLALLKPDHVVLAHWEDFFRSPAKKPRIVRGTDGKALAKSLDVAWKQKWSALEPGAVLRVYF